MIAAVASAAGHAWNVISEPWALGIVRRAFLEVVLLGLIGGTLGCWVVLYGLSYSAESLSHALFPGLVGAALLGASLITGGAVGAVVAAAAIALVGGIPRLGRDNAVAVVITSLFGLGVLLALSPASPPGVQSLLFGNVLGLSKTDLITAAVVAAFVLGALFVLHAQLLVIGFDRDHAREFGGHPLLAETALLALLALAVVVSAQGVGALLAPAVLLGPAATARLIARRMARMMVIASLVAVLAGAAGLYLSYYARTAAGASIAGMIVVAYLSVSAWTRGSFRRRSRPTVLPGARRDDRSARPVSLGIGTAARG